MCGGGGGQSTDAEGWRRRHGQGLLGDGEPPSTIPGHARILLNPP